MLVFVMLGKALWGGGRETQAALSVVVRKGRKMLKQAANSLFAEMAVRTHGCRASPAARQEGQENKSPRCHCSDKSPEGTLESHSAPRKVSCVHSLPSQHTARGLPSSQELQGALEQGESCPAAHECAHAACPQRSLGITKHRAERSLGTAAAACLGQCLGFGHCVCWRRGEEAANPPEGCACSWYHPCAAQPFTEALSPQPAGCDSRVLCCGAVLFLGEGVLKRAQRGLVTCPRLC